MCFKEEWGDFLHHLLLILIVHCVETDCSLWIFVQLICDDGDVRLVLDQHAKLDFF
jgi:hypothetical protein